MSQEGGPDCGDDGRLLALRSDSLRLLRPACLGPGFDLRAAGSGQRCPRRVRHGWSLHCGRLGSAAIRDSRAGGHPRGDRSAVLAERLLLTKLYARGLLATLLAMWGVGIVLRQGAEAIFGTTPRSVAAPITGSLNILGVQYPTYRLVATGVAVLVIALGLLVIYRTDLGLRLRASIDNREMASLLGISRPS